MLKLPAPLFLRYFEGVKIILCQIFRIRRLGPILFLGAGKTKLIPNLRWGLIGSHSDVGLMRGLRVVLCDCKFSCLSLLWDWEINNKMFDVIIETEFVENIFGSLNMS